MAVPVHRSVGEVGDAAVGNAGGRALFGHPNQIARDVAVDELSADVGLIPLASAPMSSVLPVATLEQQTRGCRRAPSDLTRAQRRRVSRGAGFGRRRRGAAAEVIDPGRLLVPEDVEVVL